MKRYSRSLVFVLVAAFCCWLILAATAYPLPSQKNSIIFYSNKKQQDLKATLCKALKEAKTAVSLQMYAITDPDILDRLQNIQKKGISCSILYDAGASSPLNHLFAQPFKGKGLMHRKIVVIDHSTVFLGSANMTTQSLRHHDNLLLGIYHPQLATFLEEDKENHFSFLLGSQQGEFWLLPDKKGIALQRLLEEINKAKKNLTIAMFTLTHPKIIQALINAKNRGVKIWLALDVFTEKGASRHAAEALFNAQIPIYCSQGQQLLHHKWVMIDHQTLIVGSANWTKAAFEKNKDCFLILKPLTKHQKKFMKSLWKTIQLESNIKEE